MNCGATATCAQRVARALRFLAFPPLRKRTWAVMTWDARRLRIGSDACTERRPLRTVTVRAWRPLIENAMSRIWRPVTVTRTTLVEQTDRAPRRAVRAGDVTFTPWTAPAGAGCAAGAGATAAGAGAGVAGAAMHDSVLTAIGAVSLPPVCPLTVPIGPHHA